MDLPLCGSTASFQQIAAGHTAMGGGRMYPRRSQRESTGPHTSSRGAAPSLAPVYHKGGGKSAQTDVARAETVSGVGAERTSRARATPRPALAPMSASGANRIAARHPSPPSSGSALLLSAPRRGGKVSVGGCGGRTHWRRCCRRCWTFCRTSQRRATPACHPAQRVRYLKTLAAVHLSLACLGAPRMRGCV